MKDEGGVMGAMERHENITRPPLDLRRIRERLRGTTEERERAIEEVRRVAKAIREHRRRRRPVSPTVVRDAATELAAVRRMLEFTPAERIRLGVERARLARMPKTLIG